MPTLQQSVNEIKRILEETIIENGEAGKLSLIRSQKPIKQIHEAVKSSLVENGIAEAQIHPPLNFSRPEVTLSGFLKPKSQDVTIFPPNVDRVEEVFEAGFLEGKTDIYGRNLTERSLSINVRSQLSSLSKNFDTLYERTFAEALNFHLRCPQMCLGEVYMIPVFEYDTGAAQEHRIAFARGFRNVEKYLQAFNAIAGRINIVGDLHKYERICLLVVDFNRAAPKIYSTDEELKQDGLLEADSIATIENLTFTQFIPSLLDTYRARFPGLL
ncbi:MAG: restriction endonuclease [Pyrinomonadaceae bacterium]